MITDTVQDRMERRLAGCLQRVLDEPNAETRTEAQEALLAYDVQQDNRARALEADNRAEDDDLAQEIERFFLWDWRS